MTTKHTFDRFILVYSQVCDCCEAEVTEICGECPADVTLCEHCHNHREFDLDTEPKCSEGGGPA